MLLDVCYQSNAEIKCFFYNRYRNLLHIQLSSKINNRCLRGQFNYGMNIVRSTRTFSLPPWLLPFHFPLPRPGQQTFRVNHGWHINYHGWLISRMWYGVEQFFKFYYPGTFLWTNNSEFCSYLSGNKQAKIIFLNCLATNFTPKIVYGLFVWNLFKTIYLLINLLIYLLIYLPISGMTFGLGNSLINCLGLVKK